MFVFFYREHYFFIICIFIFNILALLTAPILNCNDFRQDSDPPRSRIVNTTPTFTMQRNSFIFKVRSNVVFQPIKLHCANVKQVYLVFGILLFSKGFRLFR